MCMTAAMYQERQVNEHALRAVRSRVRWAVTISMISCGKRHADSCAVSGLVRRREILALLRCQTIIAKRFEALNPMAERSGESESLTHINGRAILDREDTGLTELPISSVAGNIVVVGGVKPRGARGAKLRMIRSHFPRDLRTKYEMAARPGFPTGSSFPPIICPTFFLDAEGAL